MELNTDIWGSNTDWQVDESINYYDDSKKAYNGKYRSLGDYVTNNVFELNTAIDNTILYCGQAAGVTPWGDRAIFNGFESSEGTTPTRTLEINRQADIALFTVQNNTSHFQGIDGIRALMGESTNPISLTNTGYTRWSPYARNFPDTEYPETDLPNTNYQLCPIVDFDLRCMIGVIYVDVCSTLDGTRTTMTLYDFEHGNYSNYVILYAFMRLALLSGDDVYSIAQTSSPARAIGFVDMRPIGTAAGDYINYAESVQNITSIPLFGFNESKYEWNSTYLCFDTFWGYNNGDTEYTNNMSHAGVLYSASRATFAHYRIRKDYMTYEGLYQIWCYMENTADNLEYLRKAAASYGIWFTDNPTSNILQSPTRWTDSNMMLGLLREGVGFGDYTRGTGNTDNPAYDWTSSHDSGYEPSHDVDPNTYSNTTIFNPVLDLHSMTKRYVLNGEAVDQLGRDLWQISHDLAESDPSQIWEHYEDLVIDNFLTNNPIDCIVSLDKYPITNIPTGTQAEPIKYGKISGAALGKPFNKTSYQFTFKKVPIFARFGGCFLDYEPYTHYELYVPFCDTVQIHAADIIGHSLGVQMVIDFSTGAVTAYIMADELVIDSVTGVCAINIPMTGTDGITLNAQINNGILNTKRAQSNLFLGGILGLASLNTITSPGSQANQFAQGSLDLIQSNYELKHTQVPMHRIGAASPVGSWTIELNCRLMCYYPTGDIITTSRPPSLITERLAEFGKLKGFATVKPGKVKQFSGFTQGDIKTDGIPCTDSERQRIKAAFATGVYLPKLQP